MGEGLKLICGILLFAGSFLLVFCGFGGHGIDEIPVIGDVISGIDPGGKIQSAVSPDAGKAKLFSEAVEPRDSAVRSFALSSIQRSSDGEYNVAQICDIYDRLYKSWVYVNDPSGNDYVAKASESVRLMRGDCEDFAILMASCIEAIGGTARIVCANNANGDGHAYAEVYMSDSESDVESLINSISQRYGGKMIYYHIDYEENGKYRYWLNLDWQANHPGGTFFDSVGTILVIRTNGKYERQEFAV